MLMFMLAAGLMGFALHELTPGSVLGDALIRVFLIVACLIFAILPHELAHAVTARALGWRVYQVVIGLGKTWWKRRWLGVLFDWRAVPVVGVTWTAPRKPRAFRIKSFLIVLAGPAANFVMAWAVLFLWQREESRFDMDALPITANAFFWANVLVALINLFPCEPKGGFGVPSDGKQLLELLALRKADFARVDAARHAWEALLCREEGRISEAHQWCAKGLALYPEDFYLLNTSGVVFLDAQNYARTREIFIKLLARAELPAPMRFVLLNNLAYADVVSGDPALLAEADACSKDAYAGLPWMSAVVGTRGAALAALGRHEEGIQLLEKSLQDADTRRNKAENACHIAVALHRSSCRTDAEKYLALAEQWDANCPLIRWAKQQLATPVNERGAAGAESITDQARLGGSDPLQRGS